MIEACYQEMLEDLMQKQVYMQAMPDSMPHRGKPRPCITRARAVQKAHYSPWNKKMQLSNMKSRLFSIWKSLLRCFEGLSEKKRQVFSYLGSAIRTLCLAFAKSNSTFAFRFHDFQEQLQVC